MLKKIVPLIALTLSLTAIAQDSGLVEGATGRGVAESRDMRRGEFEFRVGRFEREGNSKVLGRFSIAVTGDSRARLVRINSREVPRLAVEGNVANFAGLALLTFRTENGDRRVEGRVEVRAVDNKPKDGEGDPDVVSVRFVSRDGNLTYDFAGGVRRGDVFVKDNS